MNILLINGFIFIVAVLFCAVLGEIQNLRNQYGKDLFIYTIFLSSVIDILFITNDFKDNDAHSLRCLKNISKDLFVYDCHTLLRRLFKWKILSPY
jgi:uncharacterized membrane protein